MPPIKVLLVEDSPVAINIYKKMLNSSPHIEIIGKASNGKEGLDLVLKLKPEEAPSFYGGVSLTNFQFTNDLSITIRHLC